jgi:TRAP-type mannitol/chloroaromatic compound transport system permease small subunit
LSGPHAVLPRLTASLEFVTRLAGRAVAWLVLPMIAGLVYEVTARYLFNAPTAWAYDMTYMLYGTCFMVGSAWTLQRGGHIRTDTFYANWSPRTKAWVDIVCYLLFFFPALAVFTVLGWEYFWKSFQQNERIVTSPWLPIVWPFKFVIPATGALLLLQGVAEVLKALPAALGRTAAEAQGPDE